MARQLEVKLRTQHEGQRERAESGWEPLSLDQTVGPKGNELEGESLTLLQRGFAK